jgi:hypothetical protein
MEAGRGGSILIAICTKEREMAARLNPEFLAYQQQHLIQTLL